MRRLFLHRGVPVALMVMVGACSGKSDPSGDGDTGGSGGIPTTSADDADAGPGGSDAADGQDADAGGSGDGQDDGGTDAGDADGTADGGSESGGMNDPNNPVDCGGTIYACGNGEDDDKDGFTDLADPECTGPCDDDESSFQTGLPGDNVDCKQDCFFDGNSGQGDDGCIWDLRCDPENPGANIGCEYTGGNNCNNQPPNQSQGCIDFCSQFVPPGCDCFGCCTVQTPDGPVDIFLNSGPDCSLDNLDACTMCTSQIDDCGTPCVPEKCDVCFGETEPPEGCDDPSCPSGSACDVDNPGTCPQDFYCLLGCCYPPPPG